MKKAINFCIAVVDVALLVVILTSAFAKKEEDSSYDMYYNSPTAQETTSDQDISSDSSAQQMTMADFTWYTEGILNDWIPEYAVDIDSFDALTGTWRAYMNYDPKNVTGSEGDFLIYVDISGDPDNTKVTFDWYWMRYYSDPEGGYPDDSDDSYFYGSFSDNLLHAETDTGGKLDFKYFVSYDGCDHIIGTMEGNDGTQAIIAMIRP